jgi:hypothetical protein
MGHEKASVVIMQHFAKYAEALIGHFDSGT